MTKCVVISVLISVLLSACASPIGDPPTPDTPNPTYVVSHDTTLFEFVPLTGDVIKVTYGELLAYPQVTIEIEGKEQTGIRLYDLLQKAAVTEFHAVTVSGGGRSISLAPDQINENVLLTLTKNYTVKLVSPNIPQSQWVTVSKVVIE